MNRLSFLAVVLTAFVACTQNDQRAERALVIGPKASSGIDTLCFQRYSGLTNQDTASVKIILEGNKITGQYTNLPYEKDGRFGTITGLRNGAVIKGIWHYQQEGLDDSLAFEFKLHGNGLLQKEASFNRSTGREFLSDTAAFNLAFVKVDCKTVNFTAKRD